MHNDLTPGQRALGAALVGLPRHPFDLNKPDYLLNLVARFAAVPDAVLLTLAEVIEGQAEDGELRQQPRLQALQIMVGAALSVDAQLAVLLRERTPPARP